MECAARLGAATQHCLPLVPTPSGWGWLDQLHQVLLIAVREHQGREASPTLGIIDSQSVKVMAPAGPRGYDAAKRIYGRKRHILVDSRGNLLAVRVTDGAVQDRDGGIDLVRQVRALFPWIAWVAADGAYAGHFEASLASLRIVVEIFLAYTCSIKGLLRRGWPGVVEFGLKRPQHDQPVWASIIACKSGATAITSDSPIRIR
jgi:transposase